MQHSTRTVSGILMAAGLLLAYPAVAVDFGNMMNPSKWMGGNKDNDDYVGPPPGYGYGGEPGYGYGGAPGGYGGAPGGYGGAPGGYGGAPGGYGGAPGGYGGAPGGYGGAPGGYGGAPAYGAPAADPDAAEIERLKQRIKKLEEASKAPQPPRTGGSPAPVPLTPYSGQQQYLFK
ncbi:MAG: hypothetical protein OEN52_08955 [Gammaproteobacteria bacterium]|nr:hypothetical protein [Gammaproteobacteria bacterium]